MSPQHGRCFWRLQEKMVKTKIFSILLATKTTISQESNNNFLCFFMGLVAIIIFGIWDFGLNDMVLFAFCLVKADQYLIYKIRLTHISAVAGLKSGQSNQKRNIRVHRGDRKEKKINNLCVFSDLCGEILLGTTSDFM